MNKNRLRQKSSLFFLGPEGLSCSFAFNGNSVFCLRDFITVRTKIRDKERERIFESGVLDSEATGRLAESKTSRLRRTAFNWQKHSSLSSLMLKPH